MSKADGFENQLLEHILNNADITLIGDAGGLRGSVADGDLYLSLHTSDPVEADDQTTNETGYTGYVRIPISRDGTGWTVTANSASPQANMDFAECTAAPGGPITHFGLGTAVSGVGKLLYIGTMTPNITMAVNVIPRIKTTSTITED